MDFKDLKTWRMDQVIILNCGSLVTHNEKKKDTVMHFLSPSFRKTMCKDIFQCLTAYATASSEATAVDS